VLADRNYHQRAHEPFDRITRFWQMPIGTREPPSA
jgi:hypothetical protein